MNSGACLARRGAPVVSLSAFLFLILSLNLLLFTGVSCLSLKDFVRTGALGVRGVVGALPVGVTGADPGSSSQSKVSVLEPLKKKCLPSQLVRNCLCMTHKNAPSDSTTIKCMASQSLLRTECFTTLWTLVRTHASPLWWLNKTASSTGMNDDWPQLSLTTHKFQSQLSLLSVA